MVMNGPDNKSLSHLTFDIHLFLMNMSSLLEKQFIVFLLNISQLHWVASIYCNPWYTIAQHMKKKSGSTVTNVIEDMDTYYHGWLLYDPKSGYLKEEKMTSKERKRRDMLNWFLNMASLYFDCHQEDTMKTLNFKMHLYLQHSVRDQWIKNFNPSDAFKNKVEESLKKLSLFQET